jgi:hypothetical protein
MTSPEPISPELVLVDPELARRARLRLRDHVEPERPSRPSPPSLIGDASSASAPDRRRRVAAWALVSCIALVATGLLALFVVSRVLAPSREADRATGGGLTPTSARLQTSPAVNGRAHNKIHGQAAAPTPPRVFAWVAVRGATSYLVRFFRGGRVVFRALPTNPRITLPSRWRYHGVQLRLKPGRYRWEVRPVLGPRSRPRYGKVIVESTWTYAR